MHKNPTSYSSLSKLRETSYVKYNEIDYNYPDKHLQEDVLCLRKRNGIQFLKSGLKNTTFQTFQSGFHLMKKTAYQEDEIALIKETALNLQKRKTLYYSGHCTGDAVNYLKEILGDQLQLMYTGLQLQI